MNKSEDPFFIIMNAVMRSLDPRAQMELGGLIDQPFDKKVQALFQIIRDSKPKDNEYLTALLNDARIGELLKDEHEKRIRGL